MGMRKYARNVARYRLNELGYINLNKKRWDRDGKPVPSLFSQTWKKILTPGTPHHTEWIKCLRYVMHQRRLKGEA